VIRPYSKLAQAINELIILEQETLEGGALDLSGYKSTCGFIRGLRTAITLMEELQKEE